MELSNDYDVLYDYLTSHEDERIPCFVDYDKKPDGTPYRDVAGIVNWRDRIVISVRGYTYFQGRYPSSQNSDGFISFCKKNNVEFVIP